MNNRQATFTTLDKVPIGKKFYSLNLREVVCSKTGNQPFVGTCLRYLRLWNSEQSDKKAICVDKSKSMYQVIGG